MKLYKIFTEKDATMIEINPLAEVKEKEGISGIAFFFRSRIAKIFSVDILSHVHGCQIWIR
jgi:hypothetical protein